MSGYKRQVGRGNVRKRKEGAAEGVRRRENEGDGVCFCKSGLWGGGEGGESIESGGRVRAWRVGCTGSVSTVDSVIEQVAGSGRRWIGLWRDDFVDVT